MDINYSNATSLFSDLNMVNFVPSQGILPGKTIQKNRTNKNKTKNNDLVH